MDWFLRLAALVILTPALVWVVVYLALSGLGRLRPRKDPAGAAGCATMAACLAILVVSWWLLYH
jgi:hypothetical protein